MSNFIQQVRDFYPHYLQDHKHPLNKLFHLFGNLFIVSLAIGIVIESITAQRYYGLIILPGLLVFGIYAIVWPAHIFIEKNKPATFRVSRWITKICDWVMIYQLLTFKLKFDTRGIK